jgi:hypothetical protein
MFIRRTRFQPTRVLLLEMLQCHHLHALRGIVRRQISLAILASILHRLSPLYPKRAKDGCSKPHLGQQPSLRQMFLLEVSELMLVLWLGGVQQRKTMIVA